MKLSNTKNKFFLSVAFILVIWFAVGLVFQLVRSKQKQTTDLIADVNLLSSKKEEIKKLAKQLKDLDSKIKNTEELFLGAGQENLVAFIEIIESMSEVAGIDLVINSIEIREREEGVLAEDFDDLNLNLKIKGNWQEIFHFLNIVESLPYHITFNEANFDKAKNSSEQPDNLIWEGIVDFAVTKKTPELISG